jgi:hypothetical protein
MDTYHTYQLNTGQEYSDTTILTVNTGDSMVVDPVNSAVPDSFAGRSFYLSTRDEFDILKPETFSATTDPVHPRIILPAYEKQSAHTDWLVIVLFVIIALFATVRYSYVKFINHLFLSLINYSTSQRLLQENSYPASHGAYRLDVIFYLTLSVFVYQILNLADKPGLKEGMFRYFLVLAGVLIYFMAKKLFYLVIGILFETRNETGEYLFNLDNFNRALGLILLPFVALVSFSPANNPLYLVIAGMSIVIIFNIALLRRGAIILLRKQFSIFYLFLYLCTLEFLPLLLIYKVVVVE